MTEIKRILGTLHEQSGFELVKFEKPNLKIQVIYRDQQSENMTAKQQAGEWSMKQVYDAVEKAVNELREEPLLFSNHANERSITHRLAVHMEPLFEGWDIDCEYNRIGKEMTKYKEVFFHPGDDVNVTDFDPEGNRVFPDIVSP